MKIAIIGTRGIPNNHGGFEQFAEYLSKGLVQNGIQTTVYNSHTHPYQKKEWRGVEIVHCSDPEDKIGTAGQFIYDLNCILDARKKDFDIILQLGYTSSSVWGRFLPRKKCVVTTNMDGLEWKRIKYSKPVQRFLQYAEKLAVQFSDHLISDSVGIQQYLKGKYGSDSVFIPYGANVFNEPDPVVLNEFDVDQFTYNLLIARLEPENNIEIILDGVVASSFSLPFLVIGKHQTKYGAYLKEKFATAQNIRFLGGIYDLNKVNNLRYYSQFYFHGHTVGGTNPSLLEAMASSALICAHDNIFNQSILGPDAYYFRSSRDISNLLDNEGFSQELSSENQVKITNNIKKIEERYSWPIIVDQYIEHFKQIIQTKEKSLPIMSITESA
jgi:glycosyltransferase involved in cell wall biosynthesis